jgi:hypothetical protein
VVEVSLMFGTVNVHFALLIKKLKR